MNVTNAKRRMGVLLAVCGAVFWLACPVFAEALVEMSGKAPGENPLRYEVVPWTNGWHAAKADAEARGGHLAVITSGEEWLALTRTFSPEELAGCWLGASDEETEGTWKWVTGEPMGYVRWAGVEPNNDRGNPEGQENYLVGDDRWGIIHWNDVYEQCSEATKYLLEREGETLLPRIPRKCGTAFLPSAASVDPGKNGLAVSFYDTGSQELPYPAWMASHGSMLEWFAAMTPTLSTNTAYVGEHFAFGCNDPNLEGVHGPCRFPGKYALRGTDAFAALFRGNIDIPEAGTYRFEALGDNGSVLYIDGQLVFGALGNVNFYSGKCGGTKMLSAGVHELALAFFEQDQYQGLKLYWQPPSATKPVLLPQSVLSRPQDVPAPVAAPAGLREGLVAYWPLDGDAKDASGNGNDGVLHGAVAAADRNGKAGGALHFDGIDDSIVVPGSPSLDITNAITIAVWAKLDSARSILSVCDKNGESWRLQLYSWNPAELGNDQTAIHFAGSLPAGKWVHVAATFDGSVAKVYLNGTEAGRAARSAPFPSSGAGVHIGSDPFLQPEFFAGSLDDLAVWNRALSAEEIAELCPDAMPPPSMRTASSNLPPIRVSAPVVAPAGLREGLVAYWPLDGDAKDASGNGNDGVLNGAVPAPDRSGKANGTLRFAGKSFVEVPDKGALGAIDRTVTVAAWIKPAAWYPGDGYITNDMWQSVLCKGFRTRQFCLQIGEKPSGKWVFADGAPDLPVSVLPPLGEWSHVTLTDDGRTLRAYWNGREVGTGAAPARLARTAEALYIGMDRPGGLEYFQGDMDEVAVWNRALSAEEIAKLAAGAKGASTSKCGTAFHPSTGPVAAPAGLGEGLVAYWPLDGDAKDASGNSNDGVLHGAVAAADRNGKPSGALWFDGRSTVRVADSASLRGVTNAFTVAAWVKYDKPCIIVDSWVTILSKGTEGRQFGLNFNLTAPAANNTEIGLFQHAAFRAFPEKGVWTHVAATFDANGRSTAYVNGKAVGTWSSPRLLSVNREELVIGADPHGDAEYLFGALDDVAVWNRALSADEVAKLAAGAKVAPPMNPPRYEIVPWRKGWKAAKADAEARGGHLATITSAEEWETIRNLFPLRDLLGCWLGASDAEEEGVWQWVTGEPWGFARWDAATGQPDAMGEGQDFLWLHVDYAGRWDDIGGYDPGVAKYLLERENMPPISVSGLRHPFRLSPHVLLVEAAGGTNEVEVAACVAWAAEERVPWISLKHAHGNGPGRLVVKVSANESPAKRSAKVRVRTTWDGEWRDIAVEQRGMEQVAMPRVRSRGGTFKGPKQRVVLSCATEGAAIRYTLDGSDPDGTSPLYAGSFNLSATATVKARAFKDGMLPSGLAEASFARRTSLAEAIGMPEGIVSTDRFTGWRVEEGAGREGGPAAKSGAIGPEGRSRMEVRIEGAGTVVFWWKASCEDDLDGTGWDRVAFSVDGLEKAALDGESGWQRVEAEVKGEGVHVLAWEYAKDWIDEKPTADAAWVEGVSWRPATKRQVRSKE